MSRRISSIALGASVLLLAAGAFAEPARGPIEKRFDLERDTDSRNAKKPKPKKGADAEEAAEEEEPTEKKSKSKSKKAKKDADEPADEAEEKPKKGKGKKAKKAEPEEEPEAKEEPTKKGKGKKGKKEEPPPEEEPVDLKETESPTATPEEETPEEATPEEAPAEEAPNEEAADGEKAEAAASVSSADLAGKLFIGVRLGFGIPMGDTTGDEGALKFSNKIPIWIDLGYKFTPNLMVGLYGQYAFAGIDQCYSNATCTAHVMRFGVQAQYEFSPEAKFDPWVGLGIGYEIAGGTIEVADQGEATFSLKGFEFANLQLGADFKVSPSVGIGPFVSFSLGRYASGEVSEGGITDSGGITHKTIHEWLVLGVRGAFTL